MGFITWGVPKKTKKMCAMETQVMLGLKKPKKKVVRKSGMKYRRDEDILRTWIIKKLRTYGWKVFRIEPSFRGKWGLADLYLINPYSKKSMWMEIKTPLGVMSKDQEEFESMCIECGVRYVVVRSMDQALEAIGVKAIYD